MPFLQLHFRPCESTMLFCRDFPKLSDWLGTMKSQEADDEYKCFDYLKEHEALRKFDSHAIDEECRIQMCEWCYEIADAFEFRRETVVHALRYLDRYLCTSQGCRALRNRTIYKVAALTALYISIKVHEPTEFSLMDLVECGISVGTFSKDEFQQMEVDMLFALKWRISGASAVGFLSCFLGLMSESEDPALISALRFAAQFQVELGVSSNHLVHCRSSEIAFAAIVNAVLEVDDKALSGDKKRGFISKLEQISGLAAASDDSLRIQFILSTLLEEAVRPDAKQQQHVKSKEIENKRKLSVLKPSPPSSSDHPIPMAPLQNTEILTAA